MPSGQYMHGLTRMGATKGVFVSFKIADQDRVILRSAKTNGNRLVSNPCRSSAAR